MGLLDSLGGMLGGGGGAPKRQGFRATMHETNGLPAAVWGTAALCGAACATAADGFVKVWQTVVPAQQMMHWGFGSAALHENQGYIYCSILEVGAGQGEGLIRLCQANARETKKIIVAELDVTRLAVMQAAAWTVALARPTDRNIHMLPLPEKVEYPLVGEDSILSIEYYHTAGVAIAGLNSMVFSIPVTIYQ